MKRRRHGHAGRQRSRTYRSWNSMLDRCRNQRNVSYHLYGGRGIKVCRRWNRFEHFLADMGERPEGKSIERQDNSKGYCPSNCIWGSPKEQTRNRRVVRKVNWKGKDILLIEACENLGISHQTAYSRLIRGFPVHEVLYIGKLGSWHRNTKRDRILTVGGITKRVADWSNQTGIKEGTIHARLKRGWDSEQAISMSPKGRHKKVKIIRAS